MRKIISTVTLAAALAVSPVLATMPAAHAQGFNIEVGPNGVRAVPPPPAYGYDQPGPPRGYGERDYNRGGCSERQALNAAREEGLRRASIINVTRRSITVEGYNRGGPERIRFANAPGCPTI